MAFMGLPNEILGQIITHTLPEGFEGLALTCKFFHALCTPFLAHHNKLRFYFRDFEYYKADSVTKSPLHALALFPYSMGSAYNLIEQITVEPVVARYIQNANFDFDSCSTLGLQRDYTTDNSCIGDVAELLASSSYLKEAGLEWRKYHDEIQNDLNGANYSQHAAVFVLTLLPNLKTFQLPKYWSPVDATDGLIDAVVGKTRQTPQSHENPPSMAQVTEFKSSSFQRTMAKYILDSSVIRFHLDWAIPFLSLPLVRSFCGPTNVEGRGDSLIRYLHSGSGMALEEVHLQGASVDWISITNFLKHTPNLKTLRYSHKTRRIISPQDWDLCRFIAAIADEVGSHLTELSISINALPGKIVPGEPSMRGFQRLQKLELPLDMATCALASGVCLSGSLLGILVPASVSQLSLTSDEPDQHGMALDNMFRDFATNKASQAPGLKEIHLPCPSRKDEIGNERFAKLAVEAEKVGVSLYKIS